MLDILVSLKDASSGEPLLSLEEIKAQVTVTPSLSLSLSRKQGLLPQNLSHKARICDEVFLMSHMMNLIFVSLRFFFFWVTPKALGSMWME